MAVVNKKSGALTNRTATPKVLTNAGIEGGRLRGAEGVVDLAVADSTSSTLRFFSVPSNAVMHSLRVWSPAGGTTTKANFGLWSAADADNTGTVVDADFFGSDVTMATVLEGVEICHEADVTPGLTRIKGEQPIWQALGLSSDPNVMYDVVAQLSGAADQTGAVLVKAQYAH